MPQLYTVANDQGEILTAHVGVHTAARAILDATFESWSIECDPNAVGLIRWQLYATEQGGARRMQIQFCSLAQSREYGEVMILEQIVESMKPFNGDSVVAFRDEMFHREFLEWVDYEGDERAQETAAVSLNDWRRRTA